jgi:MinD-like ATPase involved in chromosome partitioning or flagellar assembly
MDQHSRTRLEKEIERAIADVVCKLGLKKLPLLPSQRVMQSMAQAAVSIYETAADEDSASDPSAPD